jgi:hypothetical protein
MLSNRRVGIITARRTTSDRVARVDPGKRVVLDRRLTGAGSDGGGRGGSRKWGESGVVTVKKRMMMECARNCSRPRRRAFTHGAIPPWIPNWLASRAMRDYAAALYKGRKNCVWKSRFNASPCGTGEGPVRWIEIYASRFSNSRFLPRISIFTV